MDTGKKEGILSCCLGGEPDLSAGVAKIHETGYVKNKYEGV